MPQRHVAEVYHYLFSEAYFNFLSTELCFFHSVAWNADKFSLFICTNACADLSIPCQACSLSVSPLCSATFYLPMLSVAKVI